MLANPLPRCCFFTSPLSCWCCLMPVYASNPLFNFFFLFPLSPSSAVLAASETLGKCPHFSPANHRFVIPQVLHGPILTGSPRTGDTPSVVRCILFLSSGAQRANSFSGCLFFMWSVVASALIFLVLSWCVILS